MTIGSSNIKWSDLSKESTQSTNTGQNVSIASSKGIRMMNAEYRYLTQAAAANDSLAGDGEKQNIKASDFVGTGGSSIYYVKTPRVTAINANYANTFTNAYSSGPSTSDTYSMPAWIGEGDIVLAIYCTSFTTSQAVVPRTNSHNGQTAQPWSYEYRNYVRYGSSKSGRRYYYIYVYSLLYTTTGYGRLVQFTGPSGGGSGLRFLVLRSRKYHGIGVSQGGASTATDDLVIQQNQSSTADNSISYSYQDTMSASLGDRNIIRLMVGNVSNGGYDSNPVFSNSGPSGTDWSSFTQFQTYGAINDLIWWITIMPPRASSTVTWNPDSGNNNMRILALEVQPRI